jgi:predicted nucleic acid-binding protein
MNTAGRTTCTVDSNVLVYANRSDRDFKGTTAHRLLIHLLAHNALTLPAQVMGEFYSVAVGKLRDDIGPDVALAQLIDLGRAATVLGYDRHDLVVAAMGSQLHAMSFWDALLWATAKHNGVRLIISEDCHDGRVIEGVRFADPFVPGFDIDELLAEVAAVE